MLSPEPPVLDGRQAFLDAQDAFAGTIAPVGFFTVSWYGTAVSDERGSFAVVDPDLGLADAVGETLGITYKGRQVFVYVVGSQDGLATDLGVTRRSYMALELLAVEPITASIGVITTPPGPVADVATAIDGGDPTSTFDTVDAGVADTVDPDTVDAGTSLA